MSKKYLITGVPGWLGTRFVRALCGAIAELKHIAPADAEEIRCLVEPRLDPKILEGIHPKVKIFKGDITNGSSLDSFFKGSEGATVFHLAGIIHATKGIKQLFDINVLGTKNVLDRAIQGKAKRIIAISSNSLTGANPSHTHLFTETSPYNPYMAYGRSKMQMEQLINDAFKKGAIETVILRPCWFYGPDQPPRQTLFFSLIKDGKMPIVGSGENKRSMSYIDNTCQALLLALHSQKANGQLYWIADRRPYSINEITDTIENLLEKEFRLTVAHKKMRLPNVAGSMAYCANTAMQSLGFYNPKIHVLSEINKTMACSVAKAEQELGYNPTVDLEEGMRRSIRWCLDNGYAI